MIESEAVKNKNERNEQTYCCTDVQSLQCGKVLQPKAHIQLKNAIVILGCMLLRRYALSNYIAMISLLRFQVVTGLRTIIF
jgi:hypothetical protein